MESTEPSVPPGFRFHPTDEELVGYYLNKKVACQKIDLDVIRDIDLYRIEPWDLQERCRIGHEEQREWYFFSHKDKKYPTGTRTNRATMAGFWKATGRDKPVYRRSRLIGMRKTLVFYRGRAPNGLKTDWIIHEYRLESEENGPPQEEGWVVCRAFKKRTSCQSRAAHGRWDSSFCYDETSGFVASLDHPMEYLPNNPQSFICKREIELMDNLNYLQLPHLHSPSPPLTKKPRSVSIASEQEDEEENIKVTDWRALDKFVASQLSQEDRCDGDGISEVGHCQSSNLALLFLQSSKEEGSRLLSSSSDSDLGICIFGK